MGEEHESIDNAVRRLVAGRYTRPIVLIRSYSRAPVNLQQFEYTGAGDGTVVRQPYAPGHGPYDALARAVSHMSASGGKVVLLVEELHRYDRQQLAEVSRVLHRIAQAGAAFLFIAEGSANTPGILGNSIDYAEMLYEFIQTQPARL